MYRSLRTLRPSTLPFHRAATPITLRSPTPIQPQSPVSVASLIAKRWANTTAEQQKRPSGTGDGKANDHSDPNPNKTSGAREEMKNISKDLAEIISGKGGAATVALTAREVSSHSQHGSVSDDFYSITRSIFQAVPNHAMLFGVAGLFPYIGTAGATIFMAREASVASQGGKTLTGLDANGALSWLHSIEHIQITYGAIILSFLGAIHWGLEFAKYGGEMGWKRLAVGTIPVLFAWPTTFIILTHALALVTQWIGFTGMWLVDQRASSAGWTPYWYATYRFYLSIMAGFSIIATFAGTSIYGAGAGAATDIDGKITPHTTSRVSPLKRLDRVSEKNYPTTASAKVGKVKGTMTGPIQIDEGTESYMVIRNIEKEEGEVDEEAEQEKEEDEQKNKEFQDKRDEHQQDKAPGAMKDTAQDRTGMNANIPGGKEERPDAEKQGDGNVGRKDEGKGAQKGQGGGDQMKQGMGEDGEEKGGIATSGEGKEHSGKGVASDAKKQDDKNKENVKGSGPDPSAEVTGGKPKMDKPAGEANEGGETDDKDEEKSSDEKRRSEDEGGEAGKSQAKKDNPDAKGAAGAGNTRAKV